MNKYRKIIPLCLVVMLLCTGCGSIDLTKEQNDVIAQYAAGTLLKYSHEYGWKYKRLSMGTPSIGTNTNAGNTSTNGANGTNNTVSTDPYAALVSALDISGATISLGTYVVGDRYPVEELINVPAESGKKILAVEFLIKNNSTVSIAPNATSKNISMNLSVNGGATILESATLLKNDISSLGTSSSKSALIEPGATYTAVAIFQVPEESAASVDRATVTLSIGGKTSGTITVK